LKYPVLIQERKRLCLCVLEVSNMPLFQSMSFILGFAIDRMYFFFVSFFKRWFKNTHFCNYIPPNCFERQMFVCLMIFNATFKNISVISSRSVLLVEEIGEPGENHRPAAGHWQTVSHNAVHLALIEIRTHSISGDSGYQMKE
jgi:hypothetical protein